MTNWGGAILEEILSKIYPVGAIYLSISNVNPIEALGIGNWELIDSNRALWTGNGSNGGTTKEAGLPNIKNKHALHFDVYGFGDVGVRAGGGELYYDEPLYKDGDVIKNLNSLNGWGTNNGSNYPGFDTPPENAADYKHLSFDASRANSIYGNSDTVQPPAYVVNVWKRVS